MNQNDIPKLLDASVHARRKGEKLWFLFTGEAGIGKSEIIQKWAKDQGDGFQFVDIRLAYMEGPDMVGLTYIVGGATYHAIPEFWPKKGRGIILFEELNRGHPMTQNAVMQILTDLKVGRHTIPDDFIIAAVVNPTDGYSVSDIDPALRNRFVEIPVQFSKQHFIEFATQSGWSERLVSFLSLCWEFKSISEIKEGVYISPRSLEKLNIVDKLYQEGLVEESVWRAVADSVLGPCYFSSFIAFCGNDRPVFVDDIISNKKLSLERLKNITKSVPYRGDLVHTSLSSITKGLEDGKISLSILVDLEKVLNKSVFNAFLSSLSEKKIKGLKQFVSQNKEWFVAISLRNKGGSP